MSKPTEATPEEISRAMRSLGRRGGLVKSKIKRAASRANILAAKAAGKTGGWPKGKPRKPKPQ